MSTLLASTVAAFTAALAAAHGGDEIDLARGVYPHVIVANRTFDPPLTITSADRANPAVIQGLGVGKASGVVFSNLEMTVAGVPNEAYYAMRITGNHNVAFRHVHVHGDPTLPPGKQLTAFLLTDNAGIEITDSDIGGVNNGIIANRNSDLVVSRNLLHDFGTDAFSGSAVTRFTYSGNVITDFHSNPGAHSDSVQLYTSGSTTPSSDIVIRDNLIFRGDGLPVQGPFLQDEAGTLPYRNVTIEDNLILGGIWHGIYVHHAAGALTVRNNVVASWAGIDNGSGVTTDFHAWIFYRGDLSGATITESSNAAQDYLDPLGKSRPVPVGSVKLGPVTDNGAALLGQWLAHHPGAWGAGITRP